MSDQHRYGNQQRRSGGRAPRGSTGSSGSQQYVLPATTYGQAPANAAYGGGHDSGGSQYASSSGASARGRLYDQYGRDHRSTPSRRGSQDPQDDGSLPGSALFGSRVNSISTVNTRASRVVPVGGQQFNDPRNDPRDSSQPVYISPESLFNLSLSGKGSQQGSAGTGSHHASAGAGSRPASAGMGSRHPSMDSQRQRAARMAMANTASSVQIGTTADPELTTFGEGTRSHELMLRLRLEEEARAAAAAAPPRRNRVRTFLQKSREAIDRRLHPRK